MHWCMDETLAVLALLPVIGFFFKKLHARWHTHHHHKCHEEGCSEEHLLHVIHDEGPEPEDCDPLTQETIEARFGKEKSNDPRSSGQGLGQE